MKAAFMKSRRITVVVGIGGKVADRVEWTVRDASGESLARLTIDDLVGHARTEASQCNESVDVLISTEDHALHFVCEPHCKAIEVYVDGERREPVNDCVERLHAVIDCIGYKM